MKNPLRILVIRGGALGDFVVTLPVLAALRGAFPKADLGVLCHRAHGRLVEAANCVDEWRDLEARDWAGLSGCREWPDDECGCQRAFCRRCRGIFRDNRRTSADHQKWVHQPVTGDKPGPTNW